MLPRRYKCAKEQAHAVSTDFLSVVFGVGEALFHPRHLAS